MLKAYRLAPVTSTNNHPCRRDGDAPVTLGVACSDVRAGGGIEAAGEMPKIGSHKSPIPIRLAIALFYCILHACDDARTLPTANERGDTMTRIEVRLWMDESYKDCQDCPRHLCTASVCARDGMVRCIPRPLGLFLPPECGGDLGVQMVDGLGQPNDLRDAEERGDVCIPLVCHQGRLAQ